MKKFKFTTRKIKITDSLELKAYTTKVGKTLQIIGVITICFMSLLTIKPVREFLTFIEVYKVRVPVKVVVRDSFFFVGKELKEIKPTTSGSIASITNNPGCIMKGNPKIDKYAIGVYQVDVRPFLVFPTASHGYKALEDLLNTVYANKSLVETFNMYCPGDATYAYKVAKECNVSVNTKVKDIRNKQRLIMAISGVEGFKRENSEFMKMFIKSQSTNTGNYIAS